MIEGGASTAYHERPSVAANQGHKMIKGNTRLSLMVAILAMLLSCLVSPARAADAVTAKKSIDLAEQIEFDQQKAEAYMRELQERMFKLAELTRDLEPQDSARLLLAVQKAREELIVEQMKDVRLLIDKRELAAAVEQQRDVIRKLEELRTLLLSNDLDLAIKLDRIRKIEAILTKLDPAIKEQLREAKFSDELADKQGKGEAVEPGDFENLKGEQERNREKTEAIEQEVKDLGPESRDAAGDLGDAGKEMKSAEGNLGKQKAGAAGGQQGNAAKKLQDARDKLKKERDQLVNDIQKQVREQIMANLTQILERQVKVRQTTQALAPKVLAGEREAVLSTQRLAASEDRIVQMTDQAIRLIQETEFSIALPPALQSIQRRMIYVSGDLKTGRANDTVIAILKEIEKDLQELIDAVKDSAPPEDGENQENGNQPGGQGQNDGRNKMLSELRIVRLLQVRVNEETLDVDGRRARAEADLPPELKEKVGSVREHQSQVRNTLEMIQRRVKE